MIIKSEQSRWYNSIRGSIYALQIGLVMRAL